MAWATPAAGPRPPGTRLRWPDLRRRELQQLELMDDPACDLGALERTYREFGVVNAVVAGWRWVYLRQLRPRLSSSRPNTLLDIGCGGGDVPRQLALWAARDGLPLRVTAIDADARAIAYAQSQPGQSGLEFRQALSSDLVTEGRRFDLVTSNHLLHHLSQPELTGLLNDCDALCAGGTFHSDIRRGPLAYAAFRAGTRPFFRDSFIRPDGLLSIRRSYTAQELSAVIPPGWEVQCPLPFRLLLTQATEKQHLGQPAAPHTLATTEEAGHA